MFTLRHPCSHSVTHVHTRYITLTLGPPLADKVTLTVEPSRSNLLLFFFPFQVTKFPYLDCLFFIPLLNLHSPRVFDAFFSNFRNKIHMLPRKYNVLDVEGELMKVDGLIKNMVCASFYELSRNI
jgi:hypothetical protein